MRAALGFLVACLLALPPARAASLDGLAVQVANASEPVLCAEKDNVTLHFASPEVRRFQIEAAHPVYIGGVRDDRWAADWTACEDISAATSDIRPPRTMTFRLAFDRGGGAAVRLDKLDRDRLVLDVSFDQPVGGRPFAALRSMYVT